MKRNVKIAVFASGSGTNAENIVNYFANIPEISVTCILCNNANAGVIDRAKNLKLDILVFNRVNFYESDMVLHYLSQKKVDLIVLAGFLWLIPEKLIEKYPNAIINIHPALLPKYGGKGMYGDAVHKAVSENLDTETGITIHYVNSKYDEGAIIFQKSVKIEPGEAPVSIAYKVHELEYKFFPTIIEKIAVTLHNNLIK
ncbi:MAG: phosphoribosylglycinamide formyltransferase [Bacteroidales bacterium]|nr:phosphoribosylglycinamide formyltransferase [Bacteroidales bacterium]MDY0140844.1 phosphoribosylglycinamide formyltransferase [Bacteroidales bacterium]